MLVYFEVFKLKAFTSDLLKSTCSYTTYTLIQQVYDLVIEKKVKIKLVIHTQLDILEETSVFLIIVFLPSNRFLAKVLQKYWWFWMKLSLLCETMTFFPLNYCYFPGNLLIIIQRKHLEKRSLDGNMQQVFSICCVLYGAIQ